MTATIAILTDLPGWHGRRLAQAFARLGVESAFASLSDCRVDLEVNRWGFVIPGFEARLPDAVFVREIAAGTFEQVTLRLGLLHALSEHNVPVYNTARVVERTVDKSMTSMLLRKAGIATPPTWVSEQAAPARAVLMRETAHGHRVVMKPLFGSQGQGLRLLAAGDELPVGDEYSGVYYLQRYVESDCDYLVFVVAGQAIAAMVRRGAGWVHNVALGARCEPVTLDAGLTHLAEGAVQAIDMDYAGVDIMRDRDGTAWVIEVNGIPAWRGLQTVTHVDVAERLAQDLASRYLARSGRAA
jgi:RimK family alpha-L-glutamate ligase